MFPDAILASAAIDRMFEQAEIVTFQGDSFRLKGRIHVNEIDKASTKLN
jgi:DNA replication protein DnaC